MLSRISLWSLARVGATCFHLLFSLMFLSCSTTYADTFKCTVSKFQLPGRIAGTGIAVGKDGNLWFSEPINSAIGRITPLGEYMGHFLIPALLQPRDLTAGPDGNIWFDITLGGDAARFGLVTMDGVITQYPRPPGVIAAVGVNGLTAGPDGNIWFTQPDEPLGHKFGRITVDGVITQFALSADDKPAGIASGPDGNLWFAEQTGNQIVRIRTDGVIDEKIPVPTPDGGPSGMTAGPDGNIWFTERKGRRIGRVNVRKGKLPSPYLPRISEFLVPSDAKPYEIISGPDGHLWFSEEDSDNIGYVTTDGVVREIPVPNSHGAGVAAGPDGNIWFTEPYGNEIGRINIQSCLYDNEVPSRKIHRFRRSPG